VRPCQHQPMSTQMSTRVS